MRISTSTLQAINMYGLDEAMAIVAKAGFESIDYSLIYDWKDPSLQDPTSPEFAAHFREIAATIRSHGLEIGQTHAPYATTVTRDPAVYPPLQKEIILAIYATGYMGCPYMVAHPPQLAEFANGQNADQAMQLALEHFGPMVPALKEAGVTACIENVFFTESRALPKVLGFGSDAESLSLLIDTLNETYGPHFAACLDTGHALLVGKEPADMLRILGHRTRALHVQDNKRGINDEHLIPPEGTINWKEFGKTLGEVGYPGTFNFEVIPYFNHLPRDTYNRDVFQNACTLLYSIGRSLADFAEK